MPLLILDLGINAAEVDVEETRWKESMRIRKAETM